ncbi:MAG TPA: FAD-dependent oxidoreductase [Anaerolineae bacterium]|nr:FAD-dependent oxidoreductase [Anaerolineae bacterium]
MDKFIVIGGGIVGTAIAYHLVRHGAKTILFDRQDPGRATAAGAGILSPETSDNSEPYFSLSQAAFGYYPDLIRQLQAEQAGETGFAPCGELVVAVSQDELPPFEHLQSYILARQRRKQPVEVESLSPGEAAHLFPALAPVSGALYTRRAARVDGRLLAQALHLAAVQRGLQVIQAGVDRLILANGVVSGVVAGGETYRAEGVAIAGGAWSASFGAQLGLSIPVEPQRGQLIHLKLPGIDTSQWPIVLGFRGHYLVPWPGGRVVAGATHEADVGFQAQTTAIGLYEVLHEALRVAPGLSQAEILETRVGLRPVTPDGWPIIGPAPGFANLYLATGHGATGLQLGPYTGKLAADWLLGRNLEIDLTLFNVARFL